MKNPIIGFAGMTHLGLVSSSAVAAKGFLTLCYDADGDLTDRLSKGKTHIVEPGLDELIEKNTKNQIFTNNIEKLQDCDVVYISPDVPTDDNGQSDLSGIETLIKQVASVLSENAIMVVLCQVPPGFTRSLKLTDNTRLYYQVETLVFGRAVERATHPERFIVGCALPSRPIAENFKLLLESFSCPILQMRYESAELAKISINMCLVSSISVANTLAELCESIGADWSEIAPSLKLDKRIGPYSYLSPGLGIAGGNLERDLATVINFSDKYKTDAGIVRAWLSNSVHRRDWAACILNTKVLPKLTDPEIAIWGIAYKENTHSIKNSPSLATIKNLPNVNLRVHDPVVSGDVVDRAFVKEYSSPLDAAENADVLAILTPWPQYKNILPSEIAAVMKGQYIIDPYRVLDPIICQSLGFKYYTLGVPPVNI